jgi:two-component system phosphate regulon sensor histidine kinase PhoR
VKTDDGLARIGAETAGRGGRGEAAAPEARPLWRSRFFWKLVASFAALIGFTTSAVWVLASRRVMEDARADLERSLQDRLLLLRHAAPAAFAVPPDPTLQERVRALGRETHTRYTVIRGDGVVLADSDETPERMENHADRPEIRDALARGHGASVRYSRTMSRDMMYVALPDRDGGRPAGTFRAALALDDVRARLGRLRGEVALGAAIAGLAAFLLALAVARRVVRPIASLTSMAKALASGVEGREAPAETPDELGQLARAFNRMDASLRERMDVIVRDRNQLLAVLGGMVEGVVAVDAKQRVVHMNDVAGRILGTTPRDAAGRRIWEVCRIPEALERVRAAAEDGVEGTGEALVASPPRDRAVALHASPLRDGRGDRAGAVLVLHDVTELRRLEAMRRDFVANVSHELKTPVTAVRGLVETLLDDPAMDPGAHRRFLEKIRDQSARLSALIADLLTLSRVESEDRFLERVPLDLREPVRESVRALHPIAEAKGLTLGAEIPESPVVVVGDREALRQTADNLLDNAIKYTAAGGRITVRVRSEGGEARLEVEDTGIGIEPRHQERIFERFYRVDKARSRELGGTGLGLAIVKHIALALGGNVSLRSVPGRGSTFAVRVPLDDPASRNRSDGALADAPGPAAGPPEVGV